MLADVKRAPTNGAMPPSIEVRCVLRFHHPGTQAVCLPQTTGGVIHHALQLPRAPALLVCPDLYLMAIGTLPRNR